MTAVTQPPTVAIVEDLAAAPNVVARKSSAVCGQGLLCKHLAATVRYGESGADPGAWWASGECGEILRAILDGINTGSFTRENASTWTRYARDGWAVNIAGRQFTPPHSQTITMEGNHPVAITLRAEGGELERMRVRSVAWTVSYIRASVADRALDLPARSVFVVKYLNNQRVVVRSRFDGYRAFKSNSTLTFDKGAQ